MKVFKFLIIIKMEIKKEEEVPEYYENNSEECENYDIDEENRKIYNEMFEELKLNKEEEEPLNLIDNFKKIYNEYSLSKKTTKPKQKKIIDPYTKIKELEKELTETSKEVNEYINFYKDNILLRETENFDGIIKDLDIYKKKIDNLMQSEAYKKSKGNVSRDLKKEITENLEKYNKSTQKLLNKVKEQKKDFSSGALEGLNISYELIHGFEKPEKMDLNIKEIEDKINNIEKEVGEWDKFKNKNNISEEITNLMHICDQMKKETEEENKRKVLILDNILTNYIKEKESGMEISENFIKIKELYNMLELYESFETVFEYIKKRLKAIKVIHENSDKFNDNVKELNEKIQKNEEKFKELGDKYKDTLNEFSKIEEVIKELNTIESSLSKLLI